jgi:lisH domain-containing protein FOPNL
MSATVGELNDAVVAALKEGGRYKDIKAEIRKQLFELLTHDTVEPFQSQECFLINELIREYLQFSGDSSSLSVFVRETAAKPDTINRDFLVQALNINQPHRLIPLLYTLTAAKDGSGPVDDPVRPTRDVSQRDSDDEGFFEMGIVNCSNSSFCARVDPRYVKKWGCCSTRMVSQERRKSDHCRANSLIIGEIIM